MEEQSAPSPRAMAAEAFVDRLFPEPDPGDKRELFAGHIAVEPELCERELPMAPEVVARLNGTCRAEEFAEQRAGEANDDYDGYDPEVVAVLAAADPYLWAAYVAEYYRD